MIKWRDSYKQFVLWVKCGINVYKVSLLFFQVNENCLKAFILQGKAYVGLKEYEKAIESYRNAIKAAPDKEAMINSKIQILFVSYFPSSFLCPWSHCLLVSNAPSGCSSNTCPCHHWLHSSSFAFGPTCCIIPEESQEQMQKKQSGQEMEKTWRYRQTNLVLCFYKAD